MSRIVFVGGGSEIPGLKSRVLDEVSALIEERGWNPVRGKAVEQLRLNPRLRQARTMQASDGPIEVRGNEVKATSLANGNPAFADLESNAIDEHLNREAKKSQPIDKGHLRMVTSLGAWAGGSMISQLKIPAVSVIDRDLWLQHGMAGASRTVEVSVVGQRQSMGPSSFKTGAAEKGWSLGLWG